jgi:Fur family peroxide stress response transcriptional regulator
VVIVTKCGAMSLTNMARKSKQKEAILRAVRGTTSHPSAGWVYEQVRKEIPNISLGTVYRNLGLLKEAGEIRAVGLPGTLERFDSNTQDHYHFKCEGCGRIFDLDLPVDKAMDERVRRATGFEVTYHRLEFFGRCKECA